jgi:hypothetical protein
MFYRYTDYDIYPYDLNINFKLIISNPVALLEKIDIDYARKIINEHKLITADPDHLSSYSKNMNTETIKLLRAATITQYIYDNLSSGNTIEVDLSEYRHVFFKTRAKLYVFLLSINILRLIGGYGTLAYSGHE